MASDLSHALRGRSHITSAAGGGRGVSQKLTIADNAMGGVGLKNFQQQDFM